MLLILHYHLFSIMVFFIKYTVMYPKMRLVILFVKGLSNNIIILYQQMFKIYYSCDLKLWLMFFYEYLFIYVILYFSLKSCMSF